MLAEELQFFSVHGKLVLATSVSCGVGKRLEIILVRTGAALLLNAAARAYMVGSAVTVDGGQSTNSIGAISFSVNSSVSLLWVEEILGSLY